MLRGFQTVAGTPRTLKSRRAMLDTLLRHLDMVRLWVAVALVLAWTACTGTISSHPTQGMGSGTPEDQAALQAWTTEAYPVFKSNCYACHGGVTPGENFLLGVNPDAIRSTLIGFNPQVVDLQDPVGSRVLSKGAHEGPPLSADNSTAILDWINAEAAAQSASAPPTIIETAQFVPELCTATSGVPGGSDCPINVVALDSLGLAGASVQFVAQALDPTDLYITDLYTVAATDGVYLEHPLFSTFPGGSDAPIPDLLDRFFNVKLNLAPSVSPATVFTNLTCPGPSCDHIGEGAAVFHDFTPDDPITITFKVLSPYQSDSTPPPAATGCGSDGLAAFVANAAPVMNDNGTACVSCHQGQNSGATSAMPLYDSTGKPADLTSLTDNTACLAVRSHVNFQGVAQSDVLLAPDPNSGDANHPFKLPGTTNPAISITQFQTAMTTWITVEAGSGQ